MRRAVVGASILLLAACSGPPPVSMAPPGQDAAGKLFNPPPAGMAAVYFYNPINNGPAINVTVGAMVIGSLAPATWMRVELGAGWHAMSCTTANSVNPSSITVAPGQMRFIDVEMPPGSPVCSIRETTTDTGRAAVLAGQRTMQIR
ncbi:MAG TPA: hypothetical protein VF915_26530 [Reyranella sp.]